MEKKLYKQLGKYPEFMVLAIGLILLYASQHGETNSTGLAFWGIMSIMASLAMRVIKITKDK